MARVDLKCPCGHAFFVGDVQLAASGSAECPACGEPVQSAAPPATRSRATSAKPAARAAAASPASVPGTPETGGSSRKKLIVIGGSVAGAIVLLIIILTVAFSSPSVDYEKQAAREVEQRKKAFEEALAQSPPGGSALSQKRASQAPPAMKAPPAPAPVRPSTPPPPARPAATPAPVVTVTPASDSRAVPKPVPPDLSAKVRTEVLSLPSFYMGLVLTPSELARVDKVMIDGANSPADIAFLESVVTGSKLKAVRDEIGMISQTIPTLEREAREGLPVDKVTMNDGRVLHCRVIDEGIDIVKVARTLSGGVGGQLPLRRDTITSIEKGKGVGADFEARWAATRTGSVAEQVELLGWCKENGLPGQAKLAALTILRADPSNTQARSEAGLPADPVKNAEAVASGAVIVYQGRSWAPADLREKFLKDGLALIEGQWYFRKDRSISVPSLFRYEKQPDKPVLIGANNMLCHDTETTYRMVQDPGLTTFTEQTDVRYLRRFYAPPMVVELTQSLPPGITPPATTYEQDVRVDYDRGLAKPGVLLKGEVPIFVPVGAPIIEASVMTTAEVKAGGSILVYLVTKSGGSEKRVKLYGCDHRENESHVIPPELIRGATEISLVAEIEGLAGYTQKVERRHVRNIIRQGKYVVSPALDVIHYRSIPDYKAQLFPSQPTGIGDVFRAKLVVGEPAASIDKLFASNPDALK